MFRWTPILYRRSGELRSLGGLPIRRRLPVCPTALPQFYRALLYGFMLNSATGARVWWCVFAGLIVLECLPLWVFRYFPSQDGPSHLHNALVTANYAAEPLYREYYRLTFFQPGGNLLTHFLLTGLVKI